MHRDRLEETTIGEFAPLLEDDLTEGRFITLIYGVLSSDGSFTYSNAGHGPAMVDEVQLPVGVGGRDASDPLPGLP